MRDKKTSKPKPKTTAGSACQERKVVRDAIRKQISWGIQRRSILQGKVE